MSIKSKILSLLKGKEFINLCVRGASILSRFLLIFFLSKYFPVEDMGTYGLFFTSTSLGLLVIGLDFYNYSNRELVYASSPNDKLSILKHQVIFHLITYAIVLAPFVFIFYYGFLPWKYICIFYFILISDHLSQELFRVFTIISTPIFANILLFLRTGVWALVLVAYYFISNTEHYSLDLVFEFWLCGSLLSVIVGIGKLIQLYGLKTKSKVDFKWIFSGLKVSGLYFISTLSLIGIERINRYLLKYWGGLRDVGIFTFYSQFSSVINVFVFSLIIMFIFPKMVDAHHKDDRKSFESLRKEMQKKTTIISLTLAVLLMFLIFPILSFVGKEDYYLDIPAFFILLLANVIFNISFVFHYVLYAQRADVQLLYATLICSVVSVGLNIALIPYFHIMGAAVALFFSYLLLALLKLYYSRKMSFK